MAISYDGGKRGGLAKTQEGGGESLKGKQNQSRAGKRPSPLSHNGRGKEKKRGKKKKIKL